ncbi:MAG: TonB-dependent receptor plug domain-containing protein [Proteobacteria bacterium]|nr:TonB-dependent receptor plug domain-containing protein [Pseudomonadota bacterium]
MKNIMRFMAAAAMAAGIALPVVAADPATAPEALEEIVIRASLRAVPLRELPQSVTVLDAATLAAAGVQHFEDVLGLVPGLGWASGTSRPRYFQLRGIGETEQYQGAPNPSVGFLVDDIDFSGVGMPATLFDLDHIEVLRGPGSTVYGANALAGLISLRSRDPGTAFDAHAEATLGDYGTDSLGFAIGDGRADGSAGWRVAAQRYRSDGFRRDAYLGRDDTNGYDESTVRGKLQWELLPGTRAALTLLYADLDNGYDAWSVDNSRITESNQPGRDAQRSVGAALRLTHATGAGEWLSVSSAAASHIDYSFDGDWGNDVFWGANAPYDYFEQHLRTRRTLAQDLRYIGGDSHWLFGVLRPVVGLYLLRLRESDAQLDTWDDQYYGAGQSRLNSDYQATNAAVYGSLEMRAGRHGTLTLGLRYEQRLADYADSSDLPFPSARDRMPGGNLSWLWDAGATRQYYATVSRGYKAGGFNIGADVAPAERQFLAEALWNLEFGLRAHSRDDSLSMQADVYAMRRQSMQVYSSRQLLPDNPLTYVFFTGNAAHGDNLGLESELQWRPRVRWTVSATLSLQSTRYLGYGQDGLDLRGRGQAFAPAWQYALAASYRHPSGVFARLDLQAQDGFYFSASHDQRAQQRTLVNLRAGWKRRHWTASLWARNLFDVHYAVDGFYFGDEPPDFPTKLYLQNGDPRQVGATVSYDIGGR